MIIFDIFIALLLAAGCVFLLGGALGILRMPDFYTRLHGASLLDTIALVCLLSASILYVLTRHPDVNGLITSLKIILIAVFVFITSPTATHAIADAGRRAGLKPWTRQNEEESP
ncbi:multisubunit sodium/proton antiporter MrpG subunit [Desulfobotulus alkaliphilus]|uniref:Multisubunit sodium/proton antiporter MrpG subunit n=1 Tax=Desulfobotulus alkaliphilus TaxID=622671 RepID=A0A562S8T2_9BACT|nr:monovalent cation/H(+) antiporter subunit G [Desulfobotulus alkaliphilus]TWI76846.1 multisubunit sodium/proton antiporter MrpG subunit [Desulfobotulus alkaliphilus]